MCLSWRILFRVSAAKDTSSTLDDWAAGGIPWLLQQLEQMKEDEETGPGVSTVVKCAFQGLSDVHHIFIVCSFILHIYIHPPSLKLSFCPYLAPSLWPAVSKRGFGIAVGDPVKSEHQSSSDQKSEWHIRAYCIPLGLTLF